MKFKYNVSYGIENLGLYDMIGNVPELCVTETTSSNDILIISRTTVNENYYSKPTASTYEGGVGFRVVRNIP